MRSLFFLHLLLVAFRCLPAELVRFHGSTAAYSIDSTGSMAAITRVGTDRNLVAPGEPAPVLQVRIDGRWHRPSVATWDAGRGRLTLQYGDAGAAVVVSATNKPTHLALEIVEAQPLASIEIALWGPYPLVIGETIGEIVGVVRDRKDAVGIQALNAKTLGGYPGRENDIMTEFGADDSGHYPGLPEELRKGQGFRGDTARATAFGSVLQAYVRNRDRERILPNWGHDRYRVLPMKDGGIVGSRIGLFACAEPEALDTIGKIELAEGLPHPVIDGAWGKQSPGATASYLIVDFSEETVDRAIEMTRRAGLGYLYHSSPFAEWGHFRLKPSLFPNGWEGFRNCVDKARRAGVELGVHTLSNFITPADAYVTPVPDPRLAVIGTAELVVGVDATATELVVSDPGHFKKTALNTVRIGEELIRFGVVSGEAPWRLMECQRGAWGTRAGGHAAGAEVARLLDHDYQVFLGDAALSEEMARNIAAFCNRTGIRQISFDGLEGNWASGHGQYGRVRFTEAWHLALDEGVRGKVLNDASNPAHYNWHINTRMNWGEPWYAGFRESQTLYRFKNQLLFERNLMPHMLGWFALRADTGIEDAEWLLARAAGFDAGFALATSLASTAQLEADPSSSDTARQFGATTAILAKIALWETARMSGAFTPRMKALLRDNNREFQLRAGDKERWILNEIQVTRFIHAASAGAVAEFDHVHPGSTRGLHWILRSDAKVPVGGLEVEVGGRRVFALGDRTIPPGGSIRYVGGAEAVIADGSWKEVGRVAVTALESAGGAGRIQVRLKVVMPEGTGLKVELRTLGEDEELVRER